MSKKSVHVAPSSAGQWSVRTEGSQRASSLHATKDRAVSSAREMVRKAGGEVIVHKKDGLISERNTYSGSIPAPPPGGSIIVSTMKSRVPMTPTKSGNITISAGKGNKKK